VRGEGKEKKEGGYDKHFDSEFNTYNTSIIDEMVMMI
jgi:hypothetical protein